MSNKTKIGILGLGYVGLPLAIAFGKKFDVIGYDISEKRVSELKEKKDVTLEISEQEFEESKNLFFTSLDDDLEKCSIFIITVPTPVDSENKPDLSLIESATRIVSKYIKKNSIVIYESTVFPGATEEVCVPLIEKLSGLKFNLDFFCGYSPERINPGDKKHNLENIVKVTSGSTSESAEIIDNLYRSIIKAGTFKAKSIKVAEAAKVIENTQRDINIALMNELSIIFDKMSIDTSAVLEAANTKWNFLPFTPGLVGGHCIGVDPYYLTYKSKKLGYTPEVILAGRELNDNMGMYVAQKMQEFLNSKNSTNKRRLLVLGLTFKENCPDVRNSKVFDIIGNLSSKDFLIDAYDPWIDEHSVKTKYPMNLIKDLKEDSYDGIIIAVPHDAFYELGIEKIKSYGKKESIIFDLKSLFESKYSDFRL